MWFVFRCWCHARVRSFSWCILCLGAVAVVVSFFWAHSICKFFIKNFTCKVNDMSWTIYEIYFVLTLMYRKKWNVEIRCTVKMMWIFRNIYLIGRNWISFATHDVKLGDIRTRWNLKWMSFAPPFIQIHWQWYKRDKIQIELTTIRFV